MAEENHRWTSPKGAQSTAWILGGIGLAIGMTGDLVAFELGTGLVVLACAATLYIHANDLQSAWLNRAWDPNLTLPAILIVLAVSVCVFAAHRTFHPEKPLQPTPPPTPAQYADAVVARLPTMQATQPHSVAKTPDVSRFVRQTVLASAAPSPPKAVIECHSGAMPDIDMGSNDRVYIWQLQSLVGSDEAFTEVYPLSPGVMRFNNNGQMPVTAYKCNVINYSSAALTNLRISTHITSYSTARTSNGGSASVAAVGPPSEMDSILHLLRVDITKPFGFTFYVMNYSNSLYRVKFSPMSSAVDVLSGKNVNVGIYSTTPPMEVWPE